MNLLNFASKKGGICFYRNSHSAVNTSVYIQTLLSVVQQPNLGQSNLILRFLDHTQTETNKQTNIHTHTQTNTYTPGKSGRRRRYLHNTQQTQRRNIHFLSGIRTRDPSNQAAADLLLRRHGNRYLPV